MNASYMVCVWMEGVWTPLAATDASVIPAMSLTPRSPHAYVSPTIWHCLSVSFSHHFIITQNPNTQQHTVKLHKSLILTVWMHYICMLISDVQILLKCVFHDMQTNTVHSSTVFILYADTSIQAYSTGHKIEPNPTYFISLMQKEQDGKDKWLEEEIKHKMLETARISFEKSKSSCTSAHVLGWTR